MVTIRLPEDLKERIDVARGDVPRERWVRRTLEQALGVSHPIRADVRADPSPAPARASEGTPLPKIAPRRAPR